MPDEQEKTNESRKVKKLPDNFPVIESLMDSLSLMCEAQNYGVMVVGDSDIGVHMILIGNRDHGINFASLYASHMLLGGVVHGAIDGINEKAISEQEQKPPDTNTN